MGNKRNESEWLNFLLRVPFRSKDVPTGFKMISPTLMIIDRFTENTEFESIILMSFSSPSKEGGIISTLMGKSLTIFSLLPSPLLPL